MARGFRGKEQERKKDTLRNILKCTDIHLDSQQHSPDTRHIPHTATPSSIYAKTSASTVSSISNPLAAEVDGVESKATLLKNLTIVVLEDLKGLSLIACGPDDLLKPLALSIPDNVNGHNGAAREDSWHEKFSKPSQTSDKGQANLRSFHSPILYNGRHCQRQRTGQAARQRWLDPSYCSKPYHSCGGRRQRDR
jgi:hypothetical protein